MTDAGGRDTAVRTGRTLAAMTLAAALFGLALAGSLLVAFHQPRPHQIPVAMVAPPAAARQLQARLNAALPGGFTVYDYRTPDAARAAVTGQAVDGAFLPAGRTGGPELLVASGGGTAAAGLLKTAFSQVAAAGGQHLAVTDLAPLPAGDPQGLSPFFLGLSVLLSSLTMGVTSSLAARRASALSQAAALVVFAAAVAAAATWAAGGLTGALTGHYVVTAGITALFALAVAAPTAALTRLTPAGAALAVLAFVVAGIPVSGGPIVLTGFMPSFYRALYPVLPMGVAIRAIRGEVYFAGHALRNPLGVLAIWAGAGLLTLAITHIAQAIRAGRHRTPGTYALAPSPVLALTAPEAAVAGETARVPDAPEAAPVPPADGSGIADATPGDHREPPDTSSPLLVTGRVLLPDDQPGQAIVTLTDLASRQAGRTVTAPDGTFRLTAPAEGSYLLIATPTGSHAIYQPEVRMITTSGQPLLLTLTADLAWQRVSP